MKIDSAEELKKFNKIFLVGNINDARSINKYIKNNNEKTLILFLNKTAPKNLKFLKERYANISLRLFSWSIFSHIYYERWHSHKLSIENSENIYKKIFKKNSLLFTFFSKLYSSSMTDLSFKKSIALQINEYYELIKIYELIKNYNKNIIPITYGKTYHVIKKFINTDISMDFHKKVLFHNNNFLVKKTYSQIVIFIFYPLFALLSIRKFIIKKNKKSIGIRLYEDGMGFDPNHNAGWIIDNKFFNKKNSLFIIEDKGIEKFKKDLIQNQYDFLQCSNRAPLQKCSLSFFFKIIFLYVPLSFIFFPIILFSNQLLRGEAVTAWIKFF